MSWVWKDLAAMGDRGREIVDERIEEVQVAYDSLTFKTPVSPTVLTDTELRRVNVPLLYLDGEHETMYDPNEAINRLRQVVPGIRTERISGTGHDLLFTHAEMVDRLVVGFLRP